MSEALMANLGSSDWPEKKKQKKKKKNHDRGTSPYHFPVWVPPGYLLAYRLLEIHNKLLCHVLLIAVLYFDRIIQDLKLTNQKYVYIYYYRPYYGPIFVFCTRFLMLPFLLNLSFYIKHYEILFWPPTCPAMYEVMPSGWHSYTFTT